MRDEAQRLQLPDSGRRAHNYFYLSIRRLTRKKLAMTCLVLIVIMYGSGVFAPLVAPYGYNDQDLSVAKQGPSITHPLGTDRLGRDMLSRVMYSLRTTVIITVTSLVTGALILGVTLGLVAGYFGKLADGIIMRVGEVTSAFPDIFLVLIIVATVKPRILQWVRGFEDATGIDWIVRLGIVDYTVISLALAAFSWFGMARLVRGQVLQARENQYVEAARSMGSSTRRISGQASASQRDKPGHSFRFRRPGRGGRGGGGAELAGNWHSAPHAQPGGDDFRERQHLGVAQRSPPDAGAIQRPGAAPLHLQPAG